ncbi:MAG: DUF3089 domain-containing protein [Flavobacteriaceae bacterium]|nr:DUF3089 domain-containing protein [Flavobacteriaceae bacterium]
MKNNVILSVLLISMLLLNSCSTRYLSSIYAPLDTTVDYANTSNWAVHPDNIPEQLNFISLDESTLAVDVFFVHPTILTSKKDGTWNGDINNPDYREEVLSTTIKYQSSAWYGVGRLFAPFYRDAHIRSFQNKFKPIGGDAALESAYQDVKASFQHYLENYNDGRPILIASHSQGTLHAGRLLKDFFDDKPLQNQLIAAYLVGIGIKKDPFTSISLMTSPSETGGFVSWNTYKRNKLPNDYETWYKGRIVSNPITWDNQKSSIYAEHKGVLYSDLKVYPNSMKIEVIDGMIWSRTPKVPKRILFSLVKDYHFADINLFWEDIRQNSKLRIQEYLKKS